ncbi:ejaculatory bulb-specific protein 3-like [Anabrus simplex]|uniref:ejaculatory bulb-specific protein 3-like n=1 Tax=Anabrus simplex TaxID=316456 RepID=UPI0035A27C5D
MSRTAVLCVVLVVVGCVVAEDKYTDKYDNVDIKAILTNDRLRGLYVNCLLDGGAKCPEDAKALKERLPEVLETDCAKCTDKQRSIIREIITYLKKNNPGDFEKLAKKYDPEGIYAAKHPEL